MAEFPALPLWTDAYLAECAHLTDEEHGRYLLLLIAMWRSAECRLPNDDEWLARRFRRAAEDIRAQFRPLIREFCQTTGNWITQKRLTREMEYVRSKSKQRSEAAKSRWNKDKDRCGSNAAPHQSRNAPTPTPIYSEIDKSISAAGAATDPQKEVFDLGEQLLGANAGGQVVKLRKHHGGDLDATKRTLSLAAGKSNPREYIGAVLRGETRTEDIAAETRDLYDRLGVR